MVQFITPASINMGQTSGESPGVTAGPGIFDPVPLSPFTHMTCGLYADSTRVDEGPDGITRVDNPIQQPRALYESLFLCNARGSGELTVGNPDVKQIQIPGVSFTGPMASGTIVIAPDDVGISPGDIPPTKDLLSIDSMSLHPAVFYRKSARVRAVWSQQDGQPLAAINDPAPGIGAEVLVMDEQPAFSAWVLNVDSTSMRVIVQHPLGSDLRRPRDIWEGVWMPAIVRSNSNFQPLEVFELVDLPPPDGMTLAIRGYLTRLEFISYARFDGAFLADGTSIALRPLY